MNDSWATNFQQLVAGIAAGEVRAVARGLTIMENRLHGYEQLRKYLHPLTGKAYVVGITGSPGSGKSTLTSALTAELRRRAFAVGILAVDPSSPFSGGAILGDRVRMNNLSGDEGVFIRSAANRGQLGGLVATVRDMLAVLDATGKDMLLVETVGVGQAEVEIANHAHCTVVVLTPGAGDEVQAMKAGVLEIADLLVVNKADRPEVDETLFQLRNVLGTRQKAEVWKVPILTTVATDSIGVTEVADKILEYQRLYLNSDRRREEAKRVERELISLLREKSVSRIMERFKGTGQWDEMVERVITKQDDPYSVSNYLLQNLSI